MGCSTSNEATGSKASVPAALTNPALDSLELPNEAVAPPAGKRMDNQNASISNKSKNLHEAAQRGRRESIVRLIEEGADVQEKNEQGETALHVAAKYADDDVNLELVKAGVDITRVDFAGRTVLHIAAMEGKEELVNELLRRQADVNARDVKANTPLHMAAGAAGPSREECGRLLLEAGANIHLMNDASYTPCGIADDMGSLPMKRMLEKYGGRRASLMQSS